MSGRKRASPRLLYAVYRIVSVHSFISPPRLQLYLLPDQQEEIALLPCRHVPESDALHKLFELLRRVSLHARHFLLPIHLRVSIVIDDGKPALWLNHAIDLYDIPG